MAECRQAYWSFHLGQGTIEHPYPAKAAAHSPQADRSQRPVPGTKPFIHLVYMQGFSESIDTTDSAMN